MSTLTKLAGLVAGVSTVAVLGVAFAQGQPPNPLVSDPAEGAGQQSTHITPMGETGVLAQAPEMRTATITRHQDVAVVTPAPEPAPIAAAPAAPVAQAPEQATVAMGAPAAPEQPMPARQDRN